MSELESLFWESLPTELVTDRMLGRVALSEIDYWQNRKERLGSGRIPNALGDLAVEGVGTDVGLSTRPGELIQIDGFNGGVKNWELQVLPEDRRVGVQTAGLEEGYPVFLLGGTFTGRYSGIRPPQHALWHKGIWLITFDRPGYGWSDPVDGTTVSSVADEVTTIAEAFNLTRYSVVGRSIGGPYALACATKSNENLDKVIALVSPFKAGAEHYAGYNASVFGKSDADLLAYARECSFAIFKDPIHLLEAIENDVTDSERDFMYDIRNIKMLLESYWSSVVNGSKGYARDLFDVHRRPWNVDWEKVDTPVVLWHGMDDLLVSPDHTVEAARHIPGAIVDLEEGASHFDAMRHLMPIIDKHIGMHIPPHPRRRIV